MKTTMMACGRPERMNQKNKTQSNTDRNNAVKHWMKNPESSRNGFMRKGAGTKATMAVSKAIGLQADFQVFV